MSFHKIIIFSDILPCAWYPFVICGWIHLKFLLFSLISHVTAQYVGRQEFTGTPEWYCEA